MLLRDRLLVVLVVIAALVAAGRTTLRYVERKQATLDYGSVPATELTGTILNTSPEIGRAYALAVVEKYLLIGTRRSDSALYVLSAETGELVGSAGASGDGFGRFRAPAVMVPAVGGATEGQWLYDVALRRLTRVHLSYGKPEVDHSPGGIVQLPSDLVVTDPVWLGDGTLVAPGLFSDGRFAIFDASGALEGFEGALPANPRGDSTEAIRVAYMGKLRAAPDRQLLAVSAPYAGRLDIYHTGDWQARSADVPLPFAPRYGIVEGSRGPTFAPTRDTRYGYIDLAVTPRYIFGLFSGRTEISHPGRDNYAEYVHVFDWDGRFVRAYRLNDDLFVIAVDEEGRTLYGARHLPEPAILVYELDALP